MAINIPIISEFNPAGINAAKKSFNELEGNGSKAMFLLQRAVIPAAAAIGSIAAVIKPAIDAASNMQESMSKVNVIFGKGAKSVNDFAATAARQLGQSKQSVLDAAGAFGTFGKAAGLGGEDLATFSNDFTVLATDLASFNNTSPEEAVLAIGAALRGEAEPLRRFGVLLDDATLRQEALNLGISDGKKALTSSQKILAAQAAIYKQTGDAQGDFLRTSDGLANSQRSLKAEFANLQVELGMKLLPKMQQFTKELLAISDWVKRNPQTFNIIGSGIEKIGKFLFFTNTPLGKFIGLIGDLSSLVDGAEKATGAWNDKLGVSSTQQMRAADAAGEFNKKLRESQNKVGGAKKEVESFAEALKEKLEVALDDAKSTLEDAQTAFKDFATEVADGIKSAFSFSDAQAAGEDTGEGFLKGLRDQVAGIKDYSRKIQDLLDKGLSQEALTQVLDAGSKAGISIAEQLIAGGEIAITETNALVDAANEAANKVGMNAATKWYQSGVDTAQKMVDGITTELDKMTPKLMAKMDAIAAKMKRNVDIDVVITERVNKIVSTISGNIPKMAEGGIVTKPTLAMIGEGNGAEAVIPLSKLGNMGGGDININVTGGMATSAEIGQNIVNALRAYQRTSGGLQLNIA
jgi:hypothetical protein